MVSTILLVGLISSASGPAPSVALRGLDPVALVEGKQVLGQALLRTDYGKFTYSFASEVHKRKFLADPERYAIQSEGKCLHMPQMEGDPNLFKVVDGRIYLAANPGCLAALEGNLDKYVQQINKPRKKVAILLFPHVQIIDYTGPWEVFGEAGYEVFSIAASAEPLVTVMGMRVVPNYTFASAPEADILVLPGGGVPSPLSGDDPTIKWIKRRAQQAQITMSVCNGAFWLANAGLLEGQRATTTSNQNLRALAEGFPNIKVVDDERFVDNGRIITTAGLSSGIDGALHVIERLDGRSAARAVALGLEYDWRPDAGYVRGALADKYMRRLGEFDLPQGVQLKNGDQQGDREHWERSWEISGPELSAEGVLELLDRMLARVWRKTGGSVGRDEQRTSWAFKGDDGKPWKATATVKPAQAANRLVITLAVEQVRTSAASVPGEARD